MVKDGPKLGACPLCGKNRDLPGIGLAHLCHVRDGARPKAKHPKIRNADATPRLSKSSPAVKKATKAFNDKMQQRLDPPIVADADEQVDVDLRPGAMPNVKRVEKLQKIADGVKKRGRPKTRSSEDAKAYQRDWKRKKRAAAKEGK